MGKKYNAEEVEKKWQDYWKKQKIYSFDKNSKKEIFSVDTPPPYISGKMHIGHAFSYSQQDFLIRFMRMKGFNVFYPFGTDDNGLPTERFVEKLNNVKSKNMGRSEFIDLSLKTLKKVTPDCISDFVNLAISADYDLYYSTIDKHSQKISQKSFLDLVKQGDAYQEDFPTIWCPECQTSIAQAELEDKEIGSLFSTLKFNVGGNTRKGHTNRAYQHGTRQDENLQRDTKRKDLIGGDLLIATTRPELLPACVAVFVNPKDKRYKNLVGKKAKVPLFNQEVPIIKDESADMKKGTGVLMICSFGDRFDVDAINRHKLTPKIVLNKDGTLNEEAGKYKDLDIREARKRILQDLKEKNLITEQKQISHAVNVHDKCGTCIEFLPTKQWFIKIIDKKKIWVGQGKKINWYPKFMYKRYENWVNGLEWDWSISRNRHFGIPIPVWTCEECNEKIFPEEKELPVDPLQTKKKCPKCKKLATPESMVLDTWATSSLTPQIAIGLPQVKDKIKLPLSLRPQGHDIIRTWAFYTIIKAYLHEKKLPWKDITISGNVSLGGEKMSKSKGNIVKPQEVMKEYGADALRYWAASSKLGEDLSYQEKDLVTGQKFVNKILNASRFVFMNLDKKVNKSTLCETDRLFLIKLNQVIDKCTQAFEKYEYSKSRLEADNFFWKDFADNYLELVKNRIYNGTKKEKDSANYVLYESLFAILKLMAPITPFITEEIYQTYFKKYEKQKSIHICDWPKEINVKGTKKDEETYDLLLKIMGNVRQEKAKAQKSVKAEIILNLDNSVKDKLKLVLDDLKSVVNAKEINEGKFKVEFVEDAD